MMTQDSVPVAAAWVEHLLSGTVALAVATIAVALLGLALMTGRVTARRGLEVVAGIFLIFGAPVVSAGLLGERTVSRDAAAPIPPQGAAVATVPPRPSVYDPYAGASVPPAQMQADVLSPMR